MIQIPLTSDAGGTWRETVQIDGVPFKLRFRWMERPGAWYADLYDGSGVLLIAGCRVSLRWPLFRVPKLVTMPAGEFVIVPAASGVTAITRDNLGTDVALVYLTREEVEEIEAEADTSESVTIALVP